MTFSDMAMKDADELAAILRPYHTTKASIEVFSLSKKPIPEKEYLSTTFSIMVEVRHEGTDATQKSIVMSVCETKDELYEKSVDSLFTG